MRTLPPGHWRELPVSEWPGRDQDAWDSATRKVGPLDVDGRATAFAPTTLRTMRSLYGGLLFWLGERGELDPEGGPADRLTRERLPLYLAARGASVSPNTLFNNLRMLAMTLGCLTPGQEWNWICRHPLAPRKRDAVAARRKIRVVDPAGMFAGLLQRLELMAGAPMAADTAIRTRDLLVVAVCLCTTLRLENLLGLTIGASIFRHHGGFLIRYREGAIKNERQITVMLAPEIVPHLDHYVAACRPVLLQGGAAGSTAALWLTRKGVRLSRQTAQAVFKRITTEVQGWHASPQTFRHSAVTALLRGDRRAMAVAAALLGHRNTTTTENSYDLSESAAAWAYWHALIAKYLPRRGGRGRGRGKIGPEESDR